MKLRPSDLKALRAAGVTSYRETAEGVEVLFGPVPPAASAPARLAVPQWDFCANDSHGGAKVEAAGRVLWPGRTWEPACVDHLRESEGVPRLDTRGWTEAQADEACAKLLAERAQVPAAMRVGADRLPDAPPPEDTLELLASGRLPGIAPEHGGPTS